LFNALTGAAVYAADQLFATLDPTMRRLDGLACGPVVLADTVGFIRDLPHDLVAAFRSTLAEARDADLLLHVVDASDPERDDRILDVEQVLKEIGADELPQVLVYNKVDLLKTDGPAGEEGGAGIHGVGRVDYLDSGELPRAWVSAVSGTGIDGLLGAIGARLGSERVRADLLLPTDAGRLRARLHAQGLVAGEHVDEQGWHIRIDAPRALIEPLFGLPGGDGEWLRSRLLAATDAPTYNPSTIPA
jgi:GTP-binding protein HflX